MIGVTREVNLKDFARWVDDLADQVKQQIDYRPALAKCLVAAKAELKVGFDTGTAPDGVKWPPLRFARPNTKGNDKPLLNNGLLRASVVANAAGHVESISNLEMKLGTALQQAAVMQYGAPSAIWDGRPHKAKALSIPLTKEAQRSGGPRRFPRPLFLLKAGGAKNGAFDKGRAYLAESVGKNKKARLVKHFLLVDKVVIPARPFIGISPRLADTWSEILADTVGRFWMEGPG